MAKIYHAHLYGTRNSKYDWLLNHDVLSTDWQALKPQTPFYLLVPQNTDLLSEYEQGWKITDVMPINSTGVKTHRDHFAIDFDPEELKIRIAKFRDLESPDDSIAQQYSLSDTRDWKIGLRRRSLAANKDWENYLTRCLYRPFDIRAYYHHKDVVELPRTEVMQNILREDCVGLCTTRQVNGKFMHVLCTSFPVTDCTVSNASKERTYLFPLYTYSGSVELEQLSLEKIRHPNFSQDFLRAITNKLDFIPNPESVFCYTYAIFHSSTYCSRYADFLKNDFPRVPLTSNEILFRQLAAYGEELTALHLMKSSKLDNLITHFESSGHQMVDAGHPKYANGKVIINKKGAGFTGVPEDVWSFYVGGYQVCQKWLKDRKGRVLTDEDITHYQRIVVALQETIHLMQQIDAAIPGFPIE